MNEKKVISAFFYVIISAFMISFSNSQASSQRGKETQIIDHIHDHKKAKKWAEDHYKAWNKKLSEDEKKSLKKLREPIEGSIDENMDHINYQLKIYGGDLSARPVDIPDENKRLEEHVNRITRVIKRKEGKLEKALIVYKNETLEDIIQTEDQIFQNSEGLINIDKVSELRENFLYGQHSEFRTYDLFEDLEQNEMIKWKIELPAGTHTGLLADYEVVIDKDSAFKVTAVKIIIQKGKQFIRIEAKLIPKEIVEQKNTNLLEKIQNEFRSRLHLPFDKQIITFKLTGVSNYWIAKKLPQFLDKFLTKIDLSVLNKTLQFMSRKEGYLLFTDRELFTLPEVYNSSEITLEDITEMLPATGYYNVSGNRTIFISIPYDLTKSIEIDENTLFHEFGHAVDNYGAIVLHSKTENISEIPEFQTLFAKEGKNLTEYASTHSSEFFSEAFRMMHISEQQPIVQEKAPATYQFIQNALEAIKNEKAQPQDSGIMLNPC